MISIREQIDEVKRELVQRERVYARLVEAGKLTPLVAARQTKRMQAVLATLERIEELDTLFPDVPPQGRAQ